VASATPDLRLPSQPQGITAHDDDDALGAINTEFLNCIVYLKCGFNAAENFALHQCCICTSSCYNYTSEFEWASVEQATIEEDKVYAETKTEIREAIRDLRLRVFVLTC